MDHWQNSAKHLLFVHWVAHWQSGSKNWLFTNQPVLWYIWWPTDKVVPKIALFTNQPVLWYIWWPTDKVVPNFALFTSLTVLWYRQPGHFRSKKIFFVILFTNCLFLLPKVLYTKMTGRVYSFQNCRQNKHAWGFGDCNSRLKLKFEKMCFGAISLKNTGF